MPYGHYADSTTKGLYEDYQKMREQPAQAPALWGTAQQQIQQQLAPGYSAWGPQESDARYQAMQQRIGQSYDQAGQRLSESLNQRGLLRSGLHDKLQHDFVEHPRQEALTGAARDVYVGGQEATRAAQAQALAQALGLGGQQAQFGLQQQMMPIQTGMGLHQSIFGPEAQRQAEEARARQAMWGNILGNILQMVPVIGDFFKR